MPSLFYSYIVYLGTSQDLCPTCIVQSDCKKVNELARALKEASWLTSYLLSRYLLEGAAKTKQTKKDRRHPVRDLNLVYLR